MGGGGIIFNGVSILLTDFFYTFASYIHQFVGDGGGVGSGLDQGPSPLNVFENFPYLLFFVSQLTLCAIKENLVLCFYKYVKVFPRGNNKMAA